MATTTVNPSRPTIKQMSFAIGPYSTQSGVSEAINRHIKNGWRVISVSAYCPFPATFCAIIIAEKPS
jgi:hypothetical protein